MARNETTTPEAASPRWLWTDGVPREATAAVLGGLRPVDMRAALEEVAGSVREGVHHGVGVDVLLRIWFELPLEAPAVTAAAEPAGSDVRLLLGVLAREALDKLDVAAVAAQREAGRAAIEILAADSTWEAGLGRDTVLTALATCLPDEKPAGYMKKLWIPESWNTRGAWMPSGPAEVAIRDDATVDRLLGRWKQGPGQQVKDAHCRTELDRKLYGVVRKAICVQAKAHVARMERALDETLLLWCQHA